MGEKTKALAQRQQGASITSFIERSRTDIERLIPKHLGAERMLQMLTYALKSDSKLLDCSPASLASGVITAAGLGLELNGALGHSYLIPRKSKGVMHANFQIGYKGLIQLLMRSGMFTGIDAEAVYEPDAFVYEKGLNPVLKHVPALTAERKENPPVAFYAIAYPVGGGTPTFKVLTLADVLEVRSTISYWESTPWATHPEAMALKTVIIRMCKLVPLATDAARAIEAEEQPSLQATVVEKGEVDFPQPKDTTQETAPKGSSGKPRKGKAAKKPAPPSPPQEEPPPPEQGHYDLDGFEDVGEREPGQEG